MLWKVLVALMAWLCIGSQIHSQVLLPVIQQGKWGYMNEQGEMVIPAIYDEAKLFHHSPFATVSKDGRIFQINRKGKEFDNKGVETITCFQYSGNKYCIFKNSNNEKYGLMEVNKGGILLDNDFELLTVITPKLLFCIKDSQSNIFNIETHTFYNKPFENYRFNPISSLFIFQDSTRFCFTNDDFKFISKVNATELIGESNKYIIFKNLESGIITDLFGKVLLSSTSGIFKSINENLIVLKKTDSVSVFSMINKKLNLLPGVDEIQSINSSFAIINNNKLTGVIDSLGQVIVNPLFNFINFETNIIVANSADGYHLFNYKGKPINSKPYQFVSNFLYNKAVVKINEKCGIIDTDGKTIVDLNYDQILLNSDFAKCYHGKDLTLVKFNNANKVIGREEFQNINIIKTNRVDLENIANNKSRVKYKNLTWKSQRESGHWGLFSKDRNQFILAPQFVNYSNYNERFSIVCKENIIDNKTPFCRNGTNYSQGLVDINKGTVVLPCSYAKIYLDYLDKAIIIAKDEEGKYKILDTAGRLLANRVIWFSNLESSGIRAYVGGKLSIANADTARYPVEPLDEYLNRLNIPNQNILLKYANYRPDSNIVITLTGGKWMFITPKERKNFDFDYLGKINSDVVVAAKEGKFTLLKHWSFLYPFQFDKIKQHHIDNRDFFVINEKHETPGIYDIGRKLYRKVNKGLKIYPIKCGLAKVEIDRNPDESDGKYNYMNLEGNLISSTSPIFASDFAFGHASVRIDKRWALIDTTGMIKFYDFNKIKILSEELALVRDKGQFFLSSTSGEKITDTPFKKILPFQHGYAIASCNNRWGVINEKGYPVIPFQFNNIKHTLHPEVFIINNKKSNDLYDINIHVKLLKNISDVNNKSNEILILKKKRKYYLVNTEKQVKLLPKRSVPFYSNNQITMIKKGNKFFIIKTDGFQEVVSSKQQFKFLGEDVFVAYYLKKQYLINSQGDSIKLDSITVISPFNQGFALVKNQIGKINFINKSGKLLMIDFVDEAKPFEGEYACVKVGQYWGVIDKKGNKVVEPFLNEVSLTKSGYLTFNMSNLQSIVNRSGTLIRNEAYEKIEFDKQGFILFYNSGKTLWTNTNGVEIKSPGAIISENLK